MRYFLVIFLFVGLTIGCISKNKSVTYNLEMPREKLVSVLIDVYLAESSLIEYENNLQDSMRKMFVTEIFMIQGVDKIYFDTTMAQLAKNAELYKDIHNQVLDSLKIQTDNTVEEAK